MLFDDCVCRSKVGVNAISVEIVLFKTNYKVKQKVISFHCMYGGLRQSEAGCGSRTNDFHA